MKVDYILCYSFHNHMKAIMYDPGPSKNDVREHNACYQSKIPSFSKNKVPLQSENFRNGIDIIIYSYFFNQIMKKTVFLMLVNCVIIFTACQSDIKKADSLRLENKFEEAAELYKKLSDEGDAYAKWRLSIAYRNGDGVAFDKSKELELLKQAAEGGCEEAKCDLAFAYLFDWFEDLENDSLKGKEMLDALANKSSNAYVLSNYALMLLSGSSLYEENKEKALKILNNISNKDDPAYNYVMAYVYFKGTDNIGIDARKGIEYLIKSFNNGSRYTAFIIQGIYASGYGDVRKDLAKKIEWLNRGIESNNANCMVAMSDICLSEDSTYKEYHNSPKGIELLKRAARHGSGKAYYVLGNLYDEGEYLPKDNDKAFENWEQSAELDYSEGFTNLAYAYLRGIGCEKNVNKSIELYKKAADKGSGFSAHFLYVNYYKGENGVPRDLELAKKYLLKAAKLNDPNGCYNLGQAYYQGIMVDKSIEQAFVYTKKAADMGHVDACQTIAYYYENGIGCDKNPKKAKEYRDKITVKDDK